MIPGLAGKLMAEKNRKVKTVVMCVAIAVSGVVGTLGLTTAGLVMIGANFYAIMPGRLVQFAIMTPIYCVLTSLLYFSPLTGMVVGNIRPAKLNIINLRLDITHLYYPAKNSFQKGRLKRREIFTELLLYTLTT